MDVLYQETYSYISGLISRKSMLSNEEIIDGLKSRSDNVIRHIYISSYPEILSWIGKNSGSQQDTDDVFQEALLIIYRKLNAEGLVLNCKFKTYLFSICKHLWYQELRRRSKTKTAEVDDYVYIKFEEDLYLEERLFKVYQNCLDNLELKSKEILLLSSQGKSNSEIKEIMCFPNNQAVADKKKNSKKKLIRELLDNKEYRLIIDEIHNNH